MDDSDSILGGIGEAAGAAVDLLENLGEAESDALYAVGDTMLEGVDRAVAGVAYGVGADGTAREYRDAAEDWQDMRSGDLDLMQENVEAAGRDVWGDTPPEPEVLARQEPSGGRGFTSEEGVAAIDASAGSDWLTSGDTLGEAVTAGAKAPFGDLDTVAGAGVGPESEWIIDAEADSGAGNPAKSEWLTQESPFEEEALAGKER